MSKDLKEGKAVTQADTLETARVKAHGRSLQSTLRNSNKAVTLRLKQVGISSRGSKEKPSQ